MPHCKININRVQVGPLIMDGSGQKYDDFVKNTLIYGGANNPVYRSTLIKHFVVVFEVLGALKR
jgi:hypothetical protein